MPQRRPAVLSPARARCVGKGFVLPSHLTFITHRRRRICDTITCASACTTQTRQKTTSFEKSLEFSIQNLYFNLCKKSGCPMFCNGLHICHRLPSSDPRQSHVPDSRWSNVSNLTCKLTFKPRSGWSFDVLVSKSLFSLQRNVSCCVCIVDCVDSRSSNCWW